MVLSLKILQSKFLTAKSVKKNFFERFFRISKYKTADALMPSMVFLGFNVCKDSFTFNTMAVDDVFKCFSVTLTMQFLFNRPMEDDVAKLEIK